ncbi:MAG: DMT family transporter [Silicimonas sp.]|nr:DMT family transporter [Silicimonas sp.]
MTAGDHAPDTARANLLGSVWMVIAMAGFAVEDMFIKSASQELPVGQVMTAFGLGGAIVFAIVATIRGEVFLTRQALGRTMAIRTFFEIGGRLFYTLAIALTPLSSVTAILQATPIVVVAGAALFFGENVGWRRWSAIGAGLAGVLIILRPGAEAFNALSILAVLGMLGFAGRDLATRAAPPSLGTAALGVYGFLAIVIAGAGLSLWEDQLWRMPTPETGCAILAAIGFGVLGYASLTRAMRSGEVSAVTPFRYVRLIFGIALGMAVFGERPDLATYAGSAIVVLSGLYILARGRKVG